MSPGDMILGIVYKYAAKTVFCTPIAHSTIR